MEAYPYENESWLLAQHFELSLTQGKNYPYMPFLVGTGNALLR